MEQEHKTEHLHITLTPTEKKRLSEHAKMMNLSISEYFTFVLNKKRIVICEDSRELINQIMRIGNNINQIAAVANMNRYISEYSISEVKGMVEECRDSLIQFISFIYESEPDFTQNDSVKNAIILEEVATSLRILSNRIGNMDDRMEKIETKLGL